MLLMRAFARQLRSTSAHHATLRTRLDAALPLCSSQAAAAALSSAATAAPLLRRVSSRAPVFAPSTRWFASVSPPNAKRQVVTLREEDLEESFVKGSGKGGQKINKVRNCVLLKHTPTGLHVRCQKTRSLDDNRRVARKLMLQKLDDAVNGALSARNVKINRLRKKKAHKTAKTRQKYHARTHENEDEEDEENEEDASDDEETDDGEECDDDGEDEVEVEPYKAKRK
uniref:Prokaryotic-type class I peptide chain release factors domain-containing protein n=1 Tax=Globisporangium ultimum (strain ATCC 200006 / CBS 805.95 / DAOM BR144) TaxID=431595 RepID=K3WFC9_GLOUD